MKNESMDNLKDLKIASLQAQLVVYKLKELAQDSIGVYPAAVVGGQHPYKKRTKEMVGHNAAIELLSVNRRAVSDWYGHLSDLTKTALNTLVLEDVIELEVQSPTVSCWINVNDFFNPAADAEDLTVHELEIVADMYARFELDGVLAYVSHKRGVRPWQPERTLAQYPMFDEAMLWLGRD